VVVVETRDELEVGGGVVVGLFVVVNWLTLVVDGIELDGIGETDNSVSMASVGDW